MEWHLQPIDLHCQTSTLLKVHTKGQTSTDRKPGTYYDKNLQSDVNKNKQQKDAPEIVSYLQFLRILKVHKVIPVFLLFL